MHSQARREDFQIEVNLSGAIVTGNGAMIVPIPRIFGISWKKYGIPTAGWTCTNTIKKKKTSKHRSCSGETHFNLILLGTLITAIARVRQGMEPKLKGSSSW